MNSDNMLGFDQKAKNKDRGKYIRIAVSLAVRSLIEHCEDSLELDHIVIELRRLERRAFAIRKQAIGKDNN